MRDYFFGAIAGQELQAVHGIKKKGKIRNWIGVDVV